MDIAGLEINQYFIRAIKLARSGNNLTIAKIGEVQIPPGLVSGGQILNPGEFGRVLGNFLKQHRFSNSQWIVAIDEGIVFSAYKIFPNLVDADLAEAVEINAGSLLPGNVEESSWGWQEVEPLGKINGKEIMISAISKRELNQYLTAFSQIGIVPIAIEPKSCAISRAFGKTDNLFIINIEGQMVTSIIIKNGFPRFAHDFSLKNGVEESLKEIVSEVRRVSNYYLTEKNEEKITKIILDGSGAKPEIALALSKSLDQEVVLSRDIFQIGGFKVASLSLVGAGIRALYDPQDDVSLSLLPVSAREATMEKRALIFYGGIANIVVTTCLLLLIVYFGSLMLLVYLNNKNTLLLEALSKNKTENALSESNGQNLSEINKSIREINPILQKEASLEDQIVYWSPILDSIAQLTPDGLTIIQLSTSKEDLNIVGLASSKQSLDNFKNSISGQDYTSQLSVPSTNFSDPTKISFTIQVKIKR